MKTLTLVIENQLFEHHPALQKETDFLIVESNWLANRLPYHKFRMGYILNCQREYGDYLSSLGKTVHYFKLEDQVDFEEAFIMIKKQYQTLQYCEIADKYLAREIDRLGQLHFDQVQVLKNPMFLTSKQEFGKYLSDLGSKRLLMKDYYVWQRRRLGILVNQKADPVGGAWSLDAENRLKLPKTEVVPERLGEFQSKHWNDIKDLVGSRFKKNSGIIKDLWLPVTAKQTTDFWQDFLNKSLVKFGPYEDALTSRDDYIFHSVISPMLNLGLITPMELLKQLDEFLIDKHDFSLFKVENQIIPDFYNSIEGLVRQIIGWREWIKGIYDHRYDNDFEQLNFFNSRESLPEYFYNLQESLELQENLPLYNAITKVERLGWCHHIERLMIIANWMTLNNYNPLECYDWFASQFVDASEWVMVPNVMGMGLFADGGIFASKPYISGGNYIRKMSDYGSGDWEKLWTDKFWAFLESNQDFFRTQPRLNMLLQSRLKQK